MSNNFPYAPPLSWEKIEATTLHFRRMFGAGDTGRLNIMRVLEHGLPLLDPDFYFDIREDHLMGGAEGIKLEDGGIVLAESVYNAAHEGQGRARFTVAHEIGHYVLHPAKVLNRVSIPSGQKLKTFYCPEWQANAFAASLLMPVPAIKMARTATELASVCGVSQTAAEHRWRSKKNR